MDQDTIVSITSSKRCDRSVDGTSVPTCTGTLLAVNREGDRLRTSFILPVFSPSSAGDME
jgi:hypothetical protein